LKGKKGKNDHESIQSGPKRMLVRKRMNEMMTTMGESRRVKKLGSRKGLAKWWVCRTNRLCLSGNINGRLKRKSKNGNWENPGNQST